MEHDVKISPKTISTMLDVDEALVKDIISSLEKEKYILGYNTVINWERFGENGVEAMIEVKVTPVREVGFNGVAERISRFPEVRSVYLMSGTYDVGEPDFITPWHIREMCIHSLEKGQTSYTSNYGLPELRDELTRTYYRRYGLDYNPASEILITTGVSEALDIAIRAVVNPGDEVIVVQPSLCNA